MSSKPQYDITIISIISSQSQPTIIMGNKMFVCRQTFPWFSHQQPIKQHVLAKVSV